ncbi:MAG: glycosyltransferase family 2 protein [Candidatus Aminicenantes bacterium]|nr:glycosyltransferase family 2 protein [Candidatus Aminicenantes bacterium]
MKILIAVIAYNEEKNIRSVLDDLAVHNFGYDVVVIDNGSSDRTVAIARKMGEEVVAHPVNVGGQFGTLPSYFLYSWMNRYDILCQFDGDGQHKASELKKIIEPVEKGEADYVIGSRFLEKKGFQSSFFRRIGIRLFSLLDSWIVGQKITDVTSGFRAYGKRVIDLFSLVYKHEICDTNQLLLLSFSAGARIKEVPVEMSERLYGQSEFGFFKSSGFILKGLINILGCILQKKQIKKIMGAINGNQD